MEHGADKCFEREQIPCQGLFRVSGSLQAWGLGLDWLVSSLGVSTSTGLMTYTLIGEAWLGQASP